jgi:hypothetical protein
MPITGGSAMEFETKKQKNNNFRFVNTNINDGPGVQLCDQNGPRCQSLSLKRISD